VAHEEGLNGIMPHKVARVTTLHIGPFQLENLIGVFLDEEAMGEATILGQDGFFGHESLRRFHVVFDYPHAVMYLKPNASFDKEFDFNMAGLILKRLPDGRISVFDVVENSPAANAGINAGDVVVEIDGRDVRDIGFMELESIFTHEGTTLTVAFERGDERFDREITLRRLI
jgi:membrane-associated protease RseP (regulator of RpoE activity)